jgi:hypothetical protein
MKYKDFVEEYKIVNNTPSKIIKTYPLLMESYNPRLTKLNKDIILHHTDITTVSRTDTGLRSYKISPQSNIGSPNTMRLGLNKHNLRKIFEENYTYEPTELTPSITTICPSILPTVLPSKNDIPLVLDLHTKQDDILYGVTAGFGSLFFIIIVIYVYTKYAKNRNINRYTNRYTNRYGTKNNIDLFKQNNDIYEKYNSFF